MIKSTKDIETPIRIMVIIIGFGIPIGFAIFTYII